MVHEFSYVPGDVPTAIGRAGVAMVGTPDVGTALAIHRQARSVYDAVDLLAELGFAVLPDFALAQIEPSVVTVLVRGHFAVTVDDANGRSVTTGADRDRWAEVKIPRSPEARVVVGTVNSRVGTALPVHAGVVLAAAVVLTEGARSFGPDVSADADPDPAASVESREAASDEDVSETVFDSAAEMNREGLGQPSEHESELGLAQERAPDPQTEPEVEPEPESAPEPQPEPEPNTESSADETRFDDEDDRFSAAFGRTIMGRRPEDAAVRNLEEPQRGFQIGPPPTSRSSNVEAVQPPPPVPGEVSSADPALTQAGDHDGQTMTPEQFAALRAESSVPSVSRSEPSQVRPRASLFLPADEVVLDATVVLGRRPHARQASSTDVPKLVTVDNPYVSGTHLEIRFDGTEFKVTDLSRNGTLIKYPGDPSRALEPGVPTTLVDGCELELTDGLIGTVRIGQF